MKKWQFITLAAVLGLIIIVGGSVAKMFSVQNTAIGLDEQVKESASGIEVKEKRRVDLIFNLVDTVESYNKHEKETMVQLTEARTQAKNGNVDEAQLAINAVTEAYPELKADKQYDKLMTELSVTENMIAEYRENYNIQVKAYNKHVKKFPNNIFLSIAGYEKEDHKYLEYNAPESAPQNLFNRDNKDGQ